MRCGVNAYQAFCKATGGIWNPAVVDPQCGAVGGRNTGGRPMRASYYGGYAHAGNPTVSGESFGPEGCSWVTNGGCEVRRSFHGTYAMRSASWRQNAGKAEQSWAWCQTSCHEASLCLHTTTPVMHEPNKPLKASKLRERSSLCTAERKIKKY